MWRINQRIVKLIVELMRNHETPESLVILASALDLLLCATDGMLVDGEACTLPQLELEQFNQYLSGENLGWQWLIVFKPVKDEVICTLCPSRNNDIAFLIQGPRAHVRALSISVLGAILHAGSIHSSGKQVEINGIHNPAYQYPNVDFIDWQADIVKCLTWEARSWLATGKPI